MFYIAESNKQLERLKEMGILGCYLDVITTNDNFHPALTKLVAVYIRPFDEKIDKSTGEVLGYEHGYIIPIAHDEGLCVDKETVEEILQSYQKIYVLDKKKVLYHFSTLGIQSKLKDLGLIYSMTEFQKLEYGSRETTYNWYYNRYGGWDNLNQIIPIAKIYEKCEQVFDQVKFVLDMEPPKGYEFYNSFVTPLYFLVEQEGLRVDTHGFTDTFPVVNPDYSILGETVYTQFNLYNMTGRPTNSFNGVNFLAIPKGKKFRQVFKPKNDEFVEMDFDGYHVRLVADLIKYPLNLNEKAHKQLAKECLGKEEVTQEEYAAIKQMNFQAIYGSVPTEYQNVPFFKKLREYVDTIWEKYLEEGVVNEQQSGKPFTKKLVEMHPTKLMNYMVQSLETSRNAVVLRSVLGALKGKKTRLVLITYDSFLLDVDAKEKEEGLLDRIKFLMEGGTYPVGIKSAQSLCFE